MRNNNTFINKLNLWTGVIMVLVYVTAGLFLIVLGDFIPLRLTQENRLFLGIAIILYGVYRLYRVYKKYVDQKEILKGDNENEI